MGEADVMEYSNDIAIIGLTCRFPGVDGIDDYWDKLANGVEVIRLSQTGTALEETDARRNEGTFIKTNTVMKGIENFDAEFFGINAFDAKITDPQIRVFLEVSWELLESAGYDPYRYNGLIGLFAGMGLSSYLLNNIYPNKELFRHINNVRILVGNEKDYLPSFVSYKLNLRGPSVAVQTACSTSLVAVHLACESLLTYSSDMALAGGVNITVPQLGGYFYQENGMLSRDGHVRAFDAKASGTVYNDGVAVVLLKRLNDALRDGDFIYAVIKGSAMNNDGSVRTGFTAPGINGQRDVILQALANSDVDAETITYIETHGTGTPIGDSIELKALELAYGKHTDKKGYCALGSVKTNLGHTGVASGAASLIKVVLALKNKRIPPSLNFETSGRNSGLYNSPFYINTILTDWKKEKGFRRAAVSSFGLGGTNVHMILEEAPKVSSGKACRPWHLLILSAKTQTALEMQASNLLSYLRKNPECNIADIAFTYQVGRSQFEYRQFVVCQSSEMAISSLSNKYDCNKMSQCTKGLNRDLYFVFPHKLRLEPGIIDDLYQNEKVFRGSINGMSEAIAPQLGINILEYILMDGRMKNTGSSTDINVLQWAVAFIIELSLARLWQSWGVNAKKAVGIGTGEYAAACFDGSMTVEKALELIMKNIIPTVSVKPVEVESNCELVFLIMGNCDDIGTMLGGEACEKAQVLMSLPHNGECGKTDACYNIVKVLGQLWLSNVLIDWNKYHAYEKRMRVPLPTYPFERKRYWIDEKINKTERNNPDDTHTSTCISDIPQRNTYEDIMSEISGIWEEMLGISPIGADDNFFELGGYSLIGASIITRINSVFKTYLYLRHLFENPTVSQLTECVISSLLSDIDDSEFNKMLEDLEQAK